jgi:methylated-DNA-[protein]-cysteine S-methyltransferase
MSAFAPTPLGAIGIVWSEAGIVASWMHAGTTDRAREQVRRAYPNAAETTPPAAVSTALDEIAELLEGHPRDLRAVALDMRSVPEFDRRVYEVARTIPPGSTMTYGAVAKALGEEPMRARDVGVALARNPFAPIVPCHRVMGSGGLGTGFSAHGGVTTKLKLLGIEARAAGQMAGEQTDLF